MQRMGNVICSRAAERHKTQGVLLLKRTGGMDLGEGVKSAGCQGRVAHSFMN